MTRKTISINHWNFQWKPCDQNFNCCQKKCSNLWKQYCKCQHIPFTIEYFCSEVSKFIWLLAPQSDALSIDLTSLCFSFLTLSWGRGGNLINDDFYWVEDFFIENWLIQWCEVLFMFALTGRGHFQVGKMGILEHRDEKSVELFISSYYGFWCCHLKRRNLWREADTLETNKLVKKVDMEDKAMNIIGSKKLSINDQEVSSLEKSQ